MKQRVITGVVAAALFIPLVIWGNYIFLGAVVILATIGLTELFRMRGMRLFSYSSIVSILTIWGIIVPSGLALEQAFSDKEWVTMFSQQDFIFVGALLLLVATVISKNRFTFDDASFAVLSFLYIGLSFSYFYQLRELGLVQLLHVLFLIWASDIGAYQIGRQIGKHKLWPEISPNKTIEGFFGGMVSAVVVSIVFAFFTDLDFTRFEFVFIGVLVAVVGTFGDLIQSAYKRHYGVKDSGNILPGHGGILDRFDSLMFTVPILFITGLIGG